MTPVVTSEGTAFTQKSKGKKYIKWNGDSKKKDFDKVFYKDRNLFQFVKKGHPKSHRPNLNEDKDDESVKSSKSSSSISDLKSQLKGIKKSFAQLESKFQEAESDESGESMF